MQTVILDTNALLMPFEMRINIDIEIANLVGDARIIVPGPLVGELKHLKHKFAKAAIQLARKYEIYQTDASGDEAVIEAALRTEGYVVTNDKDLRTKLRKLNIPMIYLRSGTHLILEEY